ncbi:MAG: pyridoxal-phosphate-dependent aminotransferase family protein [Candidatus Rariloculaceae bacterium]
MSNKSGQHFLQVPGPTNVPDRIIRAMARPTIDHRGPDFAALTLEIIPRLQNIFGTTEPVIIFPSSASGAWEAAIANTLSAGDKVLMFDSGFFAGNWRRIAESFGLDVEVINCDWRKGIDPITIEEKLKEDSSHDIKSVMVVHNETSTGIANEIPPIRQAINNASHPALLMVDAVSSAASVEYLHDDWGVDVTIAGSQKGLMLPPGLSFNVLSEKSIAASKQAGLPKSYWSWEDALPSIDTGFFPYTPASGIFFGLREALAIMEEEGFSNIYARHARHAEATRRAVEAWGMEKYCTIPERCSLTVTTVLVPEDVSANKIRTVILERYDMSLGTGLGKLADQVFRIGHLGSFNDLMLAGTLSGVEMGLDAAGIAHSPGGVTAALNYLKS